MRVKFSSCRRCCLPAVAVLVIIGLLASAEADGADDASAGDPYPLPNCVILEEPLDKRAKVLEHLGQEVRVCCRECADEFDKNFHNWMAVINQRIVRTQRDYYPLETCVVDGASLKDTSPLDVVFRNRLFRLCSFQCEEKLKKEPAKYFARLNAAVVEKQKPGYPLDKCIVSGKPLGKAAVDHVVGNQLVRLANANQVERFNQTPGKYLLQLRELAKKKDRKKP